MLEKPGNIGALANIGKKNNTLLGIEISSTSIKILQLSPSGNKYKVDNYIIRPLPANAVVEKNISDIDAVGECISAAVSILKPSIKDAAVAVSCSQSLYFPREIHHPERLSRHRNSLILNRKGDW